MRGELCAKKIDLKQLFSDIILGPQSLACNVAEIKLLAVELSGTTC